MSLSQKLRGQLSSWSHTATNFAKVDHAEMTRPVFIWGNGQSGTFLLYDILSLTDDFWFHHTEGDRKKGFASDKYGATYIRLNKKPVEGILHFWSGIGLPFLLSSSRGAIREPISPGDARKIDLRRVRKRYRQQGATFFWRPVRPRRLLDKSPTYTFLTNAINLAFPDALHVFVLRDPRSILHSIVRRFNEPDYEAGWRGYSSGFYADIMPDGCETFSSSSIYCRHAWQISWVLQQAFGAAESLGKRCLITRYEDITDNTQSELKRILNFIGAGIDEEFVRAISASTNRNTSLAWPESECDGSALSKLHMHAADFLPLQVFNDLAAQLGYDSRRFGELNEPGQKRDDANCVGRWHYAAAETARILLAEERRAADRYVVG